MDVVWILIIAALYIILWLFIASKASTIAADKGYDKREWFHMCFWLEVIGLLMVAAMPNRKLEQQQEKIIELLLKRTEDKPFESSSADMAVMCDASQEHREAIPQSAQQETDGRIPDGVAVDRSHDMLVCPCCGEKQRSNRNLCQKCGVKFKW